MSNQTPRMISQLYFNTFGEKFSHNPERDLSTLPIDSVVGRKCEEAIEAAAILIKGTQSYEGRTDAHRIKIALIHMMEVWYFG